MRRLSRLASYSFAALVVVACTDLGLLSGGDEPASSCAPGEQREGDGRCVPIVDGGNPETNPPGITCPAGQQDNDGDKVCAPACATANLTCVHARCDDTSGKATCACAPGYKPSADAGAGAAGANPECVWSGAILDPGFQNQPAGAWQLAGGTSIDPVAAAAISPGVASFSGLSGCTSAASVKQTIQMPTIAEGEPFALDVNGSNPLGQFYPQLRIAPLWVGGMYFGAPTKALRFCLGERAYGKDVSLIFEGDWENEGNCSPTSNASLDHAVIVPVPPTDCPIPGQVPNGDFEGTGIWTASSNAEVASGVGSNASRGGRIFSTVKCTSASLSGKMSSPWKSMDRPALSFTYKGTSGQRMYVSSQYGDIGEARGTNTFQSAQFCMPEYAKGMALTLRFTLPYRGGTCSDADVREFVFDDVTFVSDPKCPQIVSVLNGDFESTSAVTQPWALSAYELYAPMPNIVANPAAAHAGSGYMQMSLGQGCGSVGAMQVITVPEPAGGAGPAVKLWYRLPIKNQTSYTVTNSALTPSPTWTQRVVCLPPKNAGRAFPLIISGYASAACGTPLPGGFETLLVDDVEVTTDATCPAQ